jgi:hypothetical protein
MYSDSTHLIYVLYSMVSLEDKEEVDIDVDKDELGGDGLTSRDYRDRKMTEKGLQYTLQVKSYWT